MPEAGSAPAGRQRGGAPPIDLPSTSLVAATAWPGGSARQLCLAADGGGDPARADHEVLRVPRAQGRDGRANRLRIAAAAERPQQRLAVPGIVPVRAHPAVGGAPESRQRRETRSGLLAVDPQVGLAPEGRRDVSQVQPRRRRPTRPAVSAALGVQGRRGQQGGPGAGDGHVFDRQPGGQVTRGAADPEHLEPGREPVVGAGRSGPSGPAPSAAAARAVHASASKPGHSCSVIRLILPDAAASRAAPVTSGTVRPGAAAPPPAGTGRCARPAPRRPAGSAGPAAVRRHLRPRR